MPEQPLSSRLSLAQAVVSMNSNSKAVNLGLKEKGRDEDSWGMGQPKVKVLNRDVFVLKRSGYDWKEDEELPTSQTEQVDMEAEPHSSDATLNSEFQPLPTASSTKWTVSASITSKKSRFTGRSITVSNTTQASTALAKLLSDPELSLSSASHNMTAYRILNSSSAITESCSDDGEAGGGRHLLSLLQSSNLTNVLLVVSRWYGGIMLGPDRWRIMSEVSRDALSQRLRVVGIVGKEALWGLDLESSETSHTTSPVTGAGLPIHRPEAARAYLLKNFLSPPTPDGKVKKKTVTQINEEKAENLGLLLGALDMLCQSWAEWISKEELDRKAWGWYLTVRPVVDDGVAGWGGKNVVKLGDILALRRKP
jgi:Uncharacterized protein family UPF0029